MEARDPHFATCGSESFPDGLARQRTVLISDYPGARAAEQVQKWLAHVIEAALTGCSFQTLNNNEDPPAHSERHRQSRLNAI